jgi:hypothetical protein
LNSSSVASRLARGQDRVAVAATLWAATPWQRATMICPSKTALVDMDTLPMTNLPDDAAVG